MGKKRRRAELPEDMAGIGARLREVRTRQGLGVVELAALAGVDKGRVSRIEHADRLGGIHAATIVRLADALGVRVGWLLVGEPPQESDATVTGLVAPEVLEAFRSEVRSELQALRAEPHSLQPSKRASKGRDGSDVPVGPHTSRK